MTPMNRRYRTILIIAYAFPPMPYVGVHRIVRFCRYLPDNGWLPAVLTLREGHSQLTDKGLLRRLPSAVQVHRSRSCDPWLGIQRLIGRLQPAPPHRNSPILFSLGNHLGSVFRKLLRGVLLVLAQLFSVPDHQISWAPFATAMGLRLIRKERYDVILTSSPPHSTHLIGFLLATLSRTPWVADFRDPIVGNFLRVHARGPFAALSSLLERVIVGTATRVVCVSEHHRQLLQGRYRCSPDKCVLVRNGFDPALYSNVQPVWGAQFTILHTGTIYGLKTVRFFLQGLANWLESDTCSVRGALSVIFCGSPPDGLNELVRQLRLEGIVQIRGFVEQESLLPLQLGADLLLLMIESTDNSRYVVPAKIFEYIAANRPILGILPDGETREVLQGRDGFLHVPHDDYAGLAIALCRAASDYLAQRQSHPSSADAREREQSGFNAKRQIAIFAGVLDDLLGDRG